MVWREFIDWAFLGVVSGGIVVLVKILSEIKASQSDLKSKNAVLLERMMGCQREIERTEKRIELIEARIYYIEKMGKELPCHLVDPQK